MAIIKKNKYGELYVDATITYPIKGYIGEKTEHKEGDVISDEEALSVIEGTLDNYAGSNTGSEWIMNDYSKIEFNK